MLKQREVQPQFQRWRTKLMGYDFEIFYQPKSNKAADALSRMPPNAELITLVAPSLLDVHKIQQEVREDVQLQKVPQKLEEDPLSVAKLSLEQGILLYKGRLVLSKTSSIILALVTTFHDLVLGGHYGFLCTYKRMAGELRWKGMKEDVKKHVAKCDNCQKNKSIPDSVGGYIHGHCGEVTPVKRV